jgi:hypothetical protein
MIEFNIKNHVKVPTRITKTSKTCIDNILSNLNVKHVTVNDIYLSDHTYQTCEFMLDLTPTNKTESIIKRDYSENNVTKFQHLLSIESWSGIYESESFDEKFMTFYSTFLDHHESCFPIIKKNIRKSNKSWFTRRLKNMHNQLCEMSKLEKELNSIEYTNRYKQFKKLYKQEMQRAKYTYNDNKIKSSSNIMKTSWGIINETKNPNNFTPLELINDKNEIITEINKICNMFNNHFVDLPVNRILPDYEKCSQTLTPNPNSFYLTPVTPEDIIDIISKTTKKVASGTDGINGKIVKDVKHYIAAPLAYLVNCSFAAGEYPEALKHSKTIPVYKNKGSRNNTANYRPICVQNQFSKIFDMAFSNNLTKYVEKYKILSNNQNGFRQKRSTHTAISSALKYILEALNNKEKTVGLFFDLSRAFDTIDHTLLLRKLETIGVRGITNKWAESYLQNRIQTVYVNNGKSDTRENTLGVPQGSILGPLFFIIFINDMDKLLSNNEKIILYADDTNMLLKDTNATNLAAKATNSANLFNQWCITNGLTVNVNKTFHTRFLTKNILPDSNMLISICQKSIQHTQSIKFLGITLDSKLTWKNHIENVCSKLSSTCFIIKHVRHTVSESILRLLYFGIVQSNLVYGIIFWGMSSHAKKALIMQKKILRSMEGAAPTTPCKPIFKKYKILTLPCLYILNLTLYIAGNKNNLIKTSSIHDHNTRNSKNLHLPYSRLSAAQTLHEYQGIKCYNKLIKYIENTKTTKSLKHKLQTLLVDKAYYNIDEFFKDNF